MHFRAAVPTAKATARKSAEEADNSQQLSIIELAMIKGATQNTAFDGILDQESVSSA